MHIIKKEKIKRQKTYDLRIKDNHNYFVGISEINVHNSGKDPSKVDRSAAYMARYLAKNVVASGIASKCEIQIAYAIGVAEPVSLMVDTFNTADIPDDSIAAGLRKLFSCTPKNIIEIFNLKNIAYKQTSVFGHFGREEFPWEKTDFAADLIKIM